MSEHYILDGHTPIPVHLMTWTPRGDVCVSTVFLGLNHAFGNEPPELFETMIFGGLHDQHQERCSTWEQAEEMHTRACALAWPAA